MDNLGASQDCGCSGIRKLRYVENVLKDSKAVPFI